MHWLKAIRVAFQFLTRIPVPATESVGDEDRGKSLIFYPVVGLAIGGILLLLQLPFYTASASLQAALILSAWVLITGALHLDGLGDSADAWLGGHGDRERTLEIMKDSDSGVAAVVLIVLVLLVKFAALEQLLSSTPGWTALLAAPVIGRAAVVALFLTTPYVRGEGLGRPLADHLSPKSSWISVALSLAFAVVLLGLWAPLVVLLTLLMAFVLRLLMIRSIGGTTGDTAGAMIEVVELTVLVGAALMTG
ncbi:MAG: adenosylcobinamide-GDP ribazoletransferase [Gammaproteobacteria bacterium]|nr:adenosylcobinamide-GDP ribazoletransferase [Gammaproteobacteria bacterium]